MANQNSVDSNSFTDEVVEGDAAALAGHVNDAQNAHAASAISTTGSGGAFDGLNVQSNLDEISALIPPRPPTLGNFRPPLAFSGITDWGALKLRDGGFVARGDVTPPDPTDPTNDFFVYGEFWWPPYEAQNVFSASPNLPGDAFVVPGNDPDTDPTFNLDPAGTADPTYTGGGPGTAHEGGFTRTTAVLETARILPQGPNAPVVLSGALYPADRGVVALFHWPADGDVAVFLAQPLTTRVIAALLCGQGYNDTCDGEPGGLFTEGSPDVFGFPGRAAGQYDLLEIHTGVDNQTGDPIPGGPQPGAGQVRLGTDPAAGPVVPGGIPIIGGTVASTGGGNNNNFFRYRLPYLDDYSSTTGIQFTPGIQRPRYFEKPPVSVDALVDLTQAGGFANFARDYWTFQIARYRHRFTMALGADQGSYLLLHFRRERDFEAFARDGVMPDDVAAGYSLWSAGLSSYVNPESVDNLVDTTGADPVTSAAYHVVRGAAFEDVNTPLATNSLTYTFDRQPDEVMFVSGVQYFLPNGTGVGSNWQIDTLNWSVDNLWSEGYLLGNVGVAADVTQGLWHRSPVVLYLGVGTAASNILNGLGVGYTGSAFYQRVDFEYFDLDSVSGPFNLLNGPTPADSADVVLLGADTPVRFAGDAAQCHFWHDARVRVFARKPLNNASPATASTQYLFPNPGGASLLVHTTSQAPSTSTAAIYGNFKTTNPGDFPPRASLESARKDVQELFYDEVYRVADSAMVTLDPTYNVGVGAGNLVGPGLPFLSAPIELPVRFASTSLLTFGFASYLRTDLHLEDLAVSLSVATELQVSGLPDRNPSATDGVENPVPFSGMLVYPHLDFSTGFRPSVADGDVTTPQPDYSAVGDPERVYIRVFDAAYDNDSSPEPGVVGQPFLTFRLDGLQLSDFAYVPFGPGSAELAVEVKIPGWTTWMDLGRTDGDGPSKQDALTDGAGCQVVGPSTFNGRDASTGVVFAQVRVNVGPAANVFANVGATTAPIGVAPVMVRVRIRLAGASLNFSQGGAGAASNIPRALTGITLLRHSNGEGPVAYGPPTFP
jgi:hypothetical protein